MYEKKGRGSEYNRLGVREKGWTKNERWNRIYDTRMSQGEVKL